MNRSSRRKASKKEGTLSQQINNRIQWLRMAFLEDLFQDETQWTYKELFSNYDEKWREFAQEINTRKTGHVLDLEAFAEEFKPLEAPKTRFKLWLT